MMRNERGFSLVELMVAMTVTLIVSGAIYGLLTSGSNAFRREPEVADRQQNIRLAMDLISRDAFNAGAAMPTFSQVFTLNDPVGGTCTAGFNGCGVAGTLGATAAAARAPGDGGDPSQNTDSIEMVAADERCHNLAVCEGLLGSNIVTREPMPACLSAQGLVMVVDGTGFALQSAQQGTTAGVTCNSAANAKFDLGAQLTPWSAGPAPTLNQSFLYRAEVVRYAIAASGDPMDAAPALWRSQTGRYTSAGAVGAAPGGGAPWELVARGIEDMQFEYLYGSPTPAWHNAPPASVANQWGTLVREVRITLSARVTAANLQGQTRAAGGGGPDALRGQLSTTVAPRAAFNELQMGGQIR
jgi:prepilin-type N-terminal cleavage/methylation domain-containing protein